MKTAVLKGITHCNRTACQKFLVTGAIFYNKSTEANYCPECAFLINEHNPDLCILVKETSNTDEKAKLLNELKLSLKHMHPSDGLCSPRDIALVEEINKFDSLITEIENNGK